MPGCPPAAQEVPTGSSTVVVPEAFSLPVIEDAFVRHRHPHWPRLQENSRVWLRAKRLMPSEMVDRWADRLCYTDLIAGYYLGASERALEAIADFSTWFFVWDDCHDRHAVHGRTAAWAELRERLRSALDRPVAHLDHVDPLVAAFAECVQRLGEGRSDQWRVRFAGHFHGVIDAYDTEFANRSRATVPDVKTYVALRRHTFGHQVWLDLLEVAAGQELPEEVRSRPAYVRAALASQDFSAWYNDLCSLPKEIAGDEVHNLGISLIQHEGLSLEKAMKEIHRRVRMCIAEFLVAEGEILGYADELAQERRAEVRETSAAIRSCVFNMRNWFTSVYWFHHESGRYRVDSWEDRSTPPYVNESAGVE